MSKASKLNRSNNIDYIKILQVNMQQTEPCQPAGKKIFCYLILLQLQPIIELSGIILTRFVMRFLQVQSEGILVLPIRQMLIFN